MNTSLVFVVFLSGKTTVYYLSKAEAIYWFYLTHTVLGKIKKMRES